MSLARHSFAKIVPTDKRKSGSRVYSASQITSMIKANASATSTQRFASGVSSYYRVSLGMINNYAILVGKSKPLLEGVLDGNAEGGQVLDGNNEIPGLILDGD